MEVDTLKDQLNGYIEKKSNFEFSSSTKNHENFIKKFSFLNEYGINVDYEQCGLKIYNPKTIKDFFNAKYISINYVGYNEENDEFFVTCNIHGNPNGKIRTLSEFDLIRYVYILFFTDQEI